MSTIIENCKQFSKKNFIYLWSKNFIYLWSKIIKKNIKNCPGNTGIAMVLPRYLPRYFGILGTPVFLNWPLATLTLKTVVVATSHLPSPEPPHIVLVQNCGFSEFEVGSWSTWCSTAAPAGVTGQSWLDLGLEWPALPPPLLRASRLHLLHPRGGRGGPGEAPGHRGRGGGGAGQLPGERDEEPEAGQGLGEGGGQGRLLQQPVRLCGS